MLRLPLSRPIAMASAGNAIWSADADSRALVAFDPANGESKARVELAAEPVALAAAGFVAVALVSGAVIAIEAETGKVLWRRAASGGDTKLKSAAERVWLWDRRAAKLIAVDRAGEARELDQEGVTKFAPARDGVYALDAAGALSFRALDAKADLSVPLPRDVTAGAMVVCANTLSLSSVDSLLLFDLRSLALRAKLRAPEGPVPHLICDDGRLFGGGHGVFMLDPAADANARALPITLHSPLRALAVSGTKLWALESHEPIVHIAEVW